MEHGHLSFGCWPASLLCGALSSSGAYSLICFTNMLTVLLAFVFMALLTYRDKLIEQSLDDIRDRLLELEDEKEKERA